MLSGYDLAIEFRNRNWAVGDQLESTIDFMRKRRAIFVNVDAPASDHFMVMPADVDEVTNSKLGYLRLHGRNAKAYITGKTVAARFNYDYSGNEIAEVAERSTKLAREARELHVIFNNNNLDYAPRAALRLRKALGQIVNTRHRQRSCSRLEFTSCKIEISLLRPATVPACPGRWRTSSNGLPNIT